MSRYHTRLGPARGPGLRRALRLVAGPLAFALATPLAAQQTPARPPQGQQAPARPAQGQQRAPVPPAAGPGEIRGTVLDAQSGAPVSTASIAVRSLADSALVA
ncbi:MAG: hypothetical protein JO306_05595, partial [Gemmatimonadetes bacterium]|nr:hypothetical protein [Gemmatimonadota bacterium]